MPNTTCLKCSQEFYAKPTHLKRGWGKYCSLTCLNQSKVTSIEAVCATCKKVVLKKKSDIKRSKTGNVYCSRSCATITNNTLFKKWENHKNFKNGDRAYRRLAFEAFEVKCNAGQQCPLYGMKLPNFMLEVDHINGNHFDNQIENLQILCVWCHRLKTYNISGYSVEAAH